MLNKLKNRNNKCPLKRKEAYRETKAWRKRDDRDADAEPKPAKKDLFFKTCFFVAAGFITDGQCGNLF